ncbi:MAG TPA: NUDIX hydrolase [Acidobacteriaceae bacterium]|nr:NUDIX hydrolase [Acidobacteriaceae bacterium]
MKEEAVPHDPSPLEFPAKRMAAGAVIRDQRGCILIVKPVYKEGWEVPGGIVEGDESPLSCCRRELREELGVSLAVGALMAVDWMAPRSTKREAVMFLFDGGVLEEADLERLRLPPGELSEWRLVSRAELGQYLPPELAARVTSALAPLNDVYLENGAVPEQMDSISWA